MNDPRCNRFVMMLTKSEDLEIQKFRFEQRMTSKAEAARKLIRIGLRSENEKGPAEGATSPSHATETP